MAGREGFEYHPLNEGARGKHKTRLCGCILSSGEGGIRTLGGHEAHNGFRDRPIQPLWHLPKRCHPSTRPTRQSSQACRMLVSCEVNSGEIIT
jgi:hypothetical protein